MIINPLLQGLTATGVKRDQVFVGDISTQYKSGSTIVDLKVDTYSNVRREVVCVFFDVLKSSSCVSETSFSLICRSLRK